LGTHQRLPSASPQTKYGAFPLPWFCCQGLNGTVRRSDCRSALTHFASTLLIGLDAPSPPVGWHPTGLTAGAETALSCSHDGCANVPRPLRRWVLRGCNSKFFARSMAFVRGSRTRLPVGSFRRGVLRRGRLRFMLRTAGLHPPQGGLDPALRRPGLPERRRATTKVTWFLLWPDSHRLVIVSFQDARPTVHLLGGQAIRQAGAIYRNGPLWCKLRCQVLARPASACDRPSISTESGTEPGSHGRRQP
jgi:hypothetical protein